MAFNPVTYDSETSWEACQEVRAPSGGWVVQWIDESRFNDRLISGRARLLHDGAVVGVLAGVERPTAGDVSRSGDVVLVDYTTDRDERPKYRARVLFFDASGVIRAVHHFRANPGDLWTDDGRVYLTLCGTPENDEVGMARFLWDGSRLLMNSWPEHDLTQLL